MIDIERDLDLRENQKIAITRKLKDSTQIRTSESMFTRSFQGPVSAKNQALLEEYGVIGAKSTFNPHIGIDASWSFNQFTKFTGKLEVNSVIYQDGKPWMFDFTFYGNQTGLATVFGADRFSDVDFSAFDHTYSTNKILDSWTGDLFGGDLVYPLVDTERGWFYGPLDLDVNGNIGNEDNPVMVQDLKPAIRVPKLIETVFSHYGLTVDGDIITDPSNDAADMYVLLNRFSGGGRAVEDEADVATMYQDATSAQLTAVDTEAQISVANVLTDISNSWDGLKWTCQVDGQYSFSVNFFGSLSGAAAQGRYRIEYRRDGVPFGGFTHVITDGSQDVISMGQGGVFNFQVGEEVTFHLIRLEYNGDNGRDIEISDSVGENGGYFRILLISPLIGLPYTLNNQMPDIKLVDWMGKFFKSMNWNIIQDPLDSTRWTLISNADYLEQGTVRDWSKYIDISNMVYTKPEVYKNVVFKFKDSESAAHQTYLAAAGKPFGQLEIRPDVEFARETMTVENPCQIVPPALLMEIDEDGNQTGEIVNITVHKSLDLAGSPVKEDSLLFYYNGKKDTGNIWWLQDADTPNPPLASMLMTSFPQITCINGNFLDGENLNSLTYSLESNKYGTVGEQTLYARFWRGETEVQYDPNTRVMKNARLVIPPSEFYTYQLNDELFIEGQYWRIIEIKHSEDGREATATISNSRRLLPINKGRVKADNTIEFDRSPSNLEKSAYGAFKRGSSYYGSFMMIQLVPDRIRQAQVVTQVNQTIVEEINNISGRFRKYTEEP